MSYKVGDKTVNDYLVLVCVYERGYQYIGKGDKLTYNRSNAQSFGFIEANKIKDELSSDNVLIKVIETRN